MLLLLRLLLGCLLRSLAKHLVELLLRQLDQPLLLLGWRADLCLLLLRHLLASYLRGIENWGGLMWRLERFLGLLTREVSNMRQGCTSLCCRLGCSLLSGQEAIVCNH